MQLMHDVFFTLNDQSPAAREKMVQECLTYLKGHDGMVVFTAGTRVEDHRRDVNDTGFDVSMHAVFETKAQHDAYQTTPRHMEFIKRNKDGWKQVRVFDSYQRP
jgi:hypothetical protein